jgi:hypothetical protein
MTGVSFTWQLHGGGGIVPREPSYRVRVGGIECHVSPTLGLIDGAKDWLLNVGGVRVGFFDTHQEAMQAAPDATATAANLALAEIHALRKGDGPPMLFANRAS